MTRWHPDTCDGAVQGKGCIIDVADWGADSKTPVGVHVQRCERHASLTEAHADNMYTSDVRNELMKTYADVRVTMEQGKVIVKVPDVVKADVIALVNEKFSSRVMVA